MAPILDQPIMLSPTFVLLANLVLPSFGGLLPRQNVPATLPAGWASYGCYTDSPSARSLLGSSFFSSSLTIESCIGYCSDLHYAFAGVEYGSECYCSQSLATSSAAVEGAECDAMGCSGDATESCGAGNRLSVFHDEDHTAASIVQASETWAYKGCYSDSTSARTLSLTMPIMGGATTASCTAACKQAGYRYSGLEYSGECFCGSSIRAPGALTTDADCNMPCTANPSEACGDSNRVQIYEDANGPPTPAVCISTGTGQPVNLFAITPSTGVARQLGTLTAFVIIRLSYQILSLTGREQAYFVMNNGVLRPFMLADVQRPMPLLIRDGETPTFVSTFPYPAGNAEFCTQANPSGSAPLVAYKDRADAWALCANSTAGGRQDVVYKPVTNHAHYSLAGCTSVNIEARPL